MLILFTGKGGVGKSTMSATTAIHHAQKGKKTILVSSDPAHSTDDVIGQKVGFSPTEIDKNLWAMNINAEKQAKEFLDRINESMMKLTANVRVLTPKSWAKWRDFGHGRVFRHGNDLHADERCKL